jgi:hypothetical protein
VLKVSHCSKAKVAVLIAKNQQLKERLTVMSVVLVTSSKLIEVVLPLWIDPMSKTMLMQC